MKKITAICMILLLGFSLTFAVRASEPQPEAGCVIFAETVEAVPGEEVTVPVHITGNPGFTNFAIFLEYDRELLTVKSVETKNEETLYLCGMTNSINTQWKDSEEKEGIYMVSAAGETVKEDGILFAVTFETTSDFTGTAQIAPYVKYIRCRDSESLEFVQKEAIARAGAVTAVPDTGEQEGIAGDVNGDGIVEYDDVMLAYKAYLNEITLSEEQMKIADSNENGIIEEEEYKAVYAIYFGG